LSNLIAGKLLNCYYKKLLVKNSGEEQLHRRPRTPVGALVVGRALGIVVARHRLREAVHRAAVFDQHPIHVRLPHLVLLLPPGAGLRGFDRTGRHAGRSSASIGAARHPRGLSTVCSSAGASALSLSIGREPAPSSSIQSFVRAARFTAAGSIDRRLGCAWNAHPSGTQGNKNAEIHSSRSGRHAIRHNRLRPCHARTTRSPGRLGL